MPCASCGSRTTVLNPTTIRKIYGADRDFESTVADHLSRLHREEAITTAELENRRAHLYDGEMEYFCFDCGAVDSDAFDPAGAEQQVI